MENAEEVDKVPVSVPTKSSISSKLTDSVLVQEAVENPNSMVWKGSSIDKFKESEQAMTGNEIREVAEDDGQTNKETSIELYQAKEVMETKQFEDVPAELNSFEKSIAKPLTLGATKILVHAEVYFDNDGNLQKVEILRPMSKTNTVQNPKCQKNDFDEIRSTPLNNDNEFQSEILPPSPQSLPRNEEVKENHPPNNRCPSLLISPEDEITSTSQEMTNRTESRKKKISSGNSVNVYKFVSRDESKPKPNRKRKQTIEVNSISTDKKPNVDPLHESEIKNETNIGMDRITSTKTIYDQPEIDDSVHEPTNSSSKLTDIKVVNADLPSKRRRSSQSCAIETKNKIEWMKNIGNSNDIYEFDDLNELEAASKQKPNRNRKRKSIDSTKKVNANTQRVPTMDNGAKAEKKPKRARKLYVHPEIEDDAQDETKPETKPNRIPNSKLKIGKDIEDDLISEYSYMSKEIKTVADVKLRFEKNVQKINNKFKPTFDRPCNEKLNPTVTFSYRKNTTSTCESK